MDDESASGVSSYPYRGILYGCLAGGGETTLLPVIDLQGLLPPDREKQRRKLARQEGQHPSDLAKGPLWLWRAWVLRLQLQTHVLLLTLHHIITDGWSNSVLLQELTSCYQACIQGQPAALPPLPIQYADYALWQRTWLQGEVLEAQLGYWRKQLWRVQPLALPIDTVGGAPGNDHGAMYGFGWPLTLSEELVQLSREEGVTLFMLLLARLQVVLYRLTGKSDIVVGTDVANRNALETEGLIGFFVNVLALRMQVEGTQRFGELLQRVRAMVLEGYMHQEAPFELVLDEIQLGRESEGTPLVRVLLVMQNGPSSQQALPGIKREALATESARAKFDVAFFVSEGRAGIAGSVLYRAALFKQEPCY